MCLINQVQFCSDCGGAIRSPIKMSRCWSCREARRPKAPRGPHEPRGLGEPLRRRGTLKKKKQK